MSIPNASTPSSRLAVFAGGLLESIWLCLVLCTPIFFNNFSQNTYEPDRVFLIRSLAILALFAWMVKLIEQSRHHVGAIPAEKKNGFWVWFKIPFVFPLVFFLLVASISTLFSVAPLVSLMGGYFRVQNFFTVFSYLVIFVVIVANLRQREQVERLLTTVVLSSLPVVLYGIMQYFGVDPIAYSKNVYQGGRITSFMGNPIFFAAYEIMVFPLAISRVWESVLMARRGKDKRLLPLLRGVFYLLLSIGDIWAVIVSGSRGPFLGMLVALAFLAVAWAICWRKRWLVISFLTLASLVVLLIMLLNIPGLPYQEKLSSLPGMSSLGRIFEAGGFTGQLRTIYWQISERIFLPHDPVVAYDGKPDGLNFVRPLIGYGLENMYNVSQPFYDPAVTTLQRTYVPSELSYVPPDRAHNEIWDVLVSSGVLGLIAYIGLFTAIFFFGLLWCGFIPDRKAGWVFWGIYLASAIGVTVVGCLGLGLAFLGATLPMGMLVGVFLYLAWLAIFKHSGMPQYFSQRTLILTTLLAAILAHFTEVSFGIVVSGTRLMFWVFVAIILLVGQYAIYRQDELPGTKYEAETVRKVSQGANRNTGDKKRRRENSIQPVSSLDWRRLIFYGVLLGLFLVTVGFAWLGTDGTIGSWEEIIRTTFTRPNMATGEPSWQIAPCLLFIWLLMAAMFALEDVQLHEGSTWLPTWVIILTISGMIGVVFGIWQANNLTVLASGVSNAQEALAALYAYIGILGWFYIALFVLLLVGALLLCKWNKNYPFQTYPWSGLAALILLGIAITGIVMGNLRPDEGDMLMPMSTPFAESGELDMAKVVYENTLELAPLQDYYYPQYAVLLQAAGSTKEDMNQIQAHFKLAESVVRRAQQINPYYPTHQIALAGLYAEWINYPLDETHLQTLIQQTDEAYRMATIMAPCDPQTWYDWARYDLDVLNQPEEARQKLGKALAVDPGLQAARDLLLQIP